MKLREARCVLPGDAVVGAGLRAARAARAARTGAPGPRTCGHRGHQPQTAELAELQREEWQLPGLGQGKIVEGDIAR